MNFIERINKIQSDIGAKNQSIINAENERIRLREFQINEYKNREMNKEIGIISECSKLFGFLEIDKMFGDFNDEILDGNGKIEREIKKEKYEYEFSSAIGDRYEKGSLYERTRCCTEYIIATRLLWGENYEKSINIAIRHELHDTGVNDDPSPPLNTSKQYSTGELIEYNFYIMNELLGHKLDLDYDGSQHKILNYKMDKKGQRYQDKIEWKKYWNRIESSRKYKEYNFKEIINESKEFIARYLANQYLKIES